MKVLTVDGTFDGWREAAGRLVVEGVLPREVSFTEGEPQTFLPGFVAEPAAEYGMRGAGRARRVARAEALRVPAAFMSLAQRVACHRDPARWTRLYAVLWRVVREGVETLEDHADPDVAALHVMSDAVRKDEHRFHALVRFRCVDDRGAERYVAFHRPDHRTLRRAASFFVRRFAAMRWSILTPEESAHWNGAALAFGPGVRHDPASGDDAETLWRAYYASTFNPARVNPKLLRSHLPERVRLTLPESSEIEALVRGRRRGHSG